MTDSIADKFRHCPSCGQNVEGAGRNPLHCQGCDFRFFFGPCTAVAGIVTDSRGDVLLLLRAKDPGQGKYGLPGGFVDAGESAEAALIREVREEVRLNVVDTSYLTSFPNDYVYRGAAIPVVDLFFVCQVETTEQIRAQPEEVSGWHFTPLTAAELDSMAFDSNRRALEYFLAHRTS